MVQSSADRKLCMIPGPVEFHEDVLQAMAIGATSHVDPNFIEVFGHCIELLRQVFFCKEGQPFILCGSGSLGWDVCASNLIERGDKALVLTTGLFGTRFVECLKVYGAEVTQLTAPIGEGPSLEAIETELAQNKFKVVTVTHVDTSTGVLADIQKVAKLVREKSPDTLVLVDGICSAAAEAIYMDEWGIDVMMTASQKAIGVPPGLSILVASQKALQTFQNRKEPVTSFYGSWGKWIPIMKSYEARKASYFATPAVQLVYALHVGLKKLVEVGMEKVFAIHKETSDKFKKQITDMGLKLVPTSMENAAHTMTAIYYPENVEAATLLPAVSKNCVVIAGGLHPEIAAKYFRIGHMGLSVLEPERQHVTKTMDALQAALKEAGYLTK